MARLNFATCSAADLAAAADIPCVCGADGGADGSVDLHCACGAY